MGAVTSPSDEELAALDRIRIAYVLDREDRDAVAMSRADLDRDEPPGPCTPSPDVSSPGAPSIPSRSCRYCGKHRGSWAGSRLDGHALCVVGDEFKVFVGQQMRAHCRLTYAVVAQAVGVSHSVVRAWYRWYAERHVRRPVPLPVVA